MDDKHLGALTAGWPGVTRDIKWGADLVFSVGGKMFCVYCLEGSEQGKLSFKVADERFLELTDRPGFRPAPYLARAHWVTLDDPTVVPRKELEALLRNAYELIFAKLTKKLQRELSGAVTPAGADPSATPRRRR